jgi:hypothetical protein
MNYDDILAFCRTKNPALIYVGIGCAQGHHTAPYNQDQWAQEYPPVLAAETGGYRIAILIDPALERPVKALHDVGLDGTQDVVTDDAVGITFICLRQPFYWPRTPDTVHSAPHTEFMNHLCELAVYSPATHLIVHDYTGVDIRPHYPITLFNNSRLKARVLFDMSYRGGGCSLDFMNTRVLRSSNGDFLQPYYMTLQQLRPHATPELLAAEAASRRELLELFVHRYYHVLCGNKEPRHWCTETHVMNAAERLFYTYGLIPSLNVTNLRALMAEALMDFLVVRGTTMVLADMYALIDSPTADYGLALRIVHPTAGPIAVAVPAGPAT